MQQSGGHTTNCAPFSQSLVTETFASWNRLVFWLFQLQAPLSALSYIER